MINYQPVRVGLHPANQKEKENWLPCSSVKIVRMLLFSAMTGHPQTNFRP